MNSKNIIKYLIMLTVVSISTFYIPNCSIINEHAIYVGLLAATTFVFLDKLIPNIVVVSKENKKH